MNLPLLLLFAVLFYFGWSAWRRLPLHDRSFATRGGLALLLINFLLLLGLVFLPGKFKLLALVPAFLTIGSTIKVLRDARQRLRERIKVDSRFERAKRVN
jgi:hypothetical protein